MNGLTTSAARIATSTLARTWRIEVSGIHHWRGLYASGAPFVYALWHCQILPLLWHHRGTEAALLISGHRDGGVLADAAAYWGFEIIRGSSTRGGVGAFRRAVRALSAGRRVALTPDGPRGPAGVAKPGIAKLAELTGVPILPVITRVEDAWHLRSWDRFVVPKPFAEVEIHYLPPIWVGGGESVRAIGRLTVALSAGGG